MHEDHQQEATSAAAGADDASSSTGTTLRSPASAVPAAAAGEPTSAPTTPAYFSFKDFLSEEDAAQFFQLAHSAQVAQVAQYLDFLGKQPAAAHFTASAKASVSYAATRASRSSLPVERLKDTAGWSSSAGAETHCCSSQEVIIDPAILQELLAGETRSGFGAFGTEEGFLPQKQLSLAVATAIEEVGHEYVVERNKKGEVRAPVLNSRSFFFYWCHAEKQKLVDIRRKLDACGLGRPQHDHHGGSCRSARRRDYWHRLVIVVDRAMCLDCIQFATCFARNEQIHLAIEDPDAVRIFPPAAAESVQLISLR